MFTLPSASSIIGVVSTTNEAASTGIIAYSPGLTSAFLPVIWLVLGLTVAVVLVKYIRRNVGKGIRRVTGHR